MVILIPPAVREVDIHIGNVVCPVIVNGIIPEPEDEVNRMLALLHIVHGIGGRIVCIIALYLAVVEGFDSCVSCDDAFCDDVVVARGLRCNLIEVPCCELTDGSGKLEGSAAEVYILIVGMLCSAVVLG